MVKAINIANGKKPINTSNVKKMAIHNPSKIKNKMKRSEMYGKYLMEKKQQKREKRKKRLKEGGELGEAESFVKQNPKTLENTRESEISLVQPNDDEIQQDENEDEFASYFKDLERPKILITTRPKPSAELFHFIRDLMRFIPKMFYYPRKTYSIKDICQFGQNKEFTHLIVLSEKSKVCNGMIVSHLSPTKGTGGPTAFFKVTNVIPSTDIPDHGVSTDHVPELVLNGFGTRLGHRVGRFLGSLFPHNAEFQGRQVATFHNQRDYIFVRHHRYVFEENKDKTRARLQELGPRFTLKMRWLQDGMFDTQFGEYEWIHKRKEMDTSRRKFHL